MSIIEYYGDSTPGGVIRYWERKTKHDCAREILRCWNRIEELEQALAQQQESEPVAIVRFHSAPKPGIEWLIDEVRNGSMLYLHPPAAQALTEQEQNDMGIGARWRRDSSLETWFPYTAQRLAELEAKAALPQVPEGWDEEAYKSACDGFEYWKARAEESEQSMRRMQDDLSPTHMGEPVVPELVPHGFTEAVRQLIFAARTSGGTAGRDVHLCAALDKVEALLPAAKEES